MMRNADGMSALDMAIRRGAGRSAALIAEAASKERKRRRSRLRRLSTSAVALRRQDRYKSEEPPTVRVRDIEEALRKRREEEERIEQIMSEEVEKAGQKVKQADMAQQRTISTNSSAASIEEQPGGQVESRNFAQKAVSSLTEKLSNVLRSKKNRVETLPPVDPRRKDLRSKAQGSLDNTEPFTPDVMEEGEIETLGPDGLYPSEERAMAQSYRFPKILHRRRAASEHRSAANKK